MFETIQTFIIHFFGKRCWFEIIQNCPQTHLATCLIMLDLHVAFVFPSLKHEG